VVLVDPRLEVLSYGWPSGVSEDDVRRASDHRPVLAEIRVPDQ
jgi:endonuclease/exonuclease/phosphatase family metal-dependent hydrolase